MDIDTLHERRIEASEGRDEHAGYLWLLTYNHNPDTEQQEHEPQYCRLSPKQALELAVELIEVANGLIPVNHVEGR